MDKRLELRIYDKFEHKYWNENSIRENAEWLLFGEENKENIEIERSTGLKDKNGKLIYEGDIVECDEGIGKVFYSIPTASLGIEFSDYSIYGSNICHYDIDEIDCVIIGNIHENKELLDE